MHHIARCHEVLSALVHLSAKTANQVFIEVAHHAIWHSVWVQINLGEVLANLVENPSLVQARDCVREIELLKNDSGVVREMRDVVQQVLCCLTAAQVTQRVL